MEFSRFKKIIINNRKYEDSVKQALNEFYDRVQWSGDIPKIMKEIGKKLDVFMFEIPIYDSDFGAVYLNTGYTKYLLLNSNQPRNKMYFAFCHDIYHILKGTPDYINEKREVHLNQDYTDDENECQANLFSANLLMPELEFKKMYELYRKDREDISLVVIRLMNYFNSPFMAVLIRLYEINILDKVEDATVLLDLTNESVENLFKKLWIDQEILKPTLKDDMPYIFEKLDEEGKRLLEEQLISEYYLGKITNSIRGFYQSIKLRNEDE